MKVISYIAVLNLAVLSMLALGCQPGGDSAQSTLQAEQRDVDQPLRSQAIKDMLCEDISEEFGDIAGADFDCAMLGHTVTKMYFDQDQLTMMNIKSETDDIECFSQAKRVFAHREVDDNGDIVDVPQSWRTQLHTCDVSNIEVELTSIAENAAVLNGSAAVEDYDISTLDPSEITAELETRIAFVTGGSSECVFYTTTETNESLDLVGNSGAFDFNTFHALHDLRARGVVEAVIGLGPDIEHGSSEYCSYYFVYVYTTGGKVLKLFYDQTT